MIYNIHTRGHQMVIQQRRDNGTWWVNCGTLAPRCARIICRRWPMYDSECETLQDARDLARWHAGGQRGPAPGTVTQLDLFDTAGGAS